MEGANSQTLNNYVETTNSHADVRADEMITEQKQAVLAQWQSSGFVNSAQPAGEQSREQREIGAGASSDPPAGTAETVRSLIESMSAKVHDAACFHIKRHPKTVYKVLYREAGEQQIREYIQAKKKAAQCCGSCLAWAVSA